MKHSVRYTKENRSRLWYSSWRIPRSHAVSLHLILLTLLALTLCKCGGGSGSTATSSDPQVSGNWQFKLATKGTSLDVNVSPLQGGFLLQTNGSITGQAVFSLVLPPQNSGSPITCNSGTANVTGTVSGQSVNLTAVMGTLDENGNPTMQTLNLKGGTLNSNNSAIQKGTWTLSAGYYLVINGKQNQFLPCGGGSQDTGTWDATLVPPLTGGFQGFFHSTTSTSFTNQDVSVSATFNQGPNVGAPTATVTGTLLFQDPVTLLNDYPCLTTASVNGTISGNSVLLQIFSTNGTVIGQIGQMSGSTNTTPSPVTFEKTQAGYVLHNPSGASPNQPGGGYLVTTKSCSNGDSGNLCLALGSSKACSQPVTLTPFALAFPPQLVGSTATSQTITLSNNTSSALTGLSLRFGDNDSNQFYPLPGADFNGVPNFTEQDTCLQQGTVSLDPGSSCVITVNFSPQESCPWLPQSQTQNGLVIGAAPATCPLPLTATLTITVPSGSADADNEFSVPITGIGLSRIVPSVPEIDFGAYALGEASSPQTLTFMNQSSSPITILPAGAPCAFPTTSLEPSQPRPPISSTGATLLPGIQFAETGASGAFNTGAILNEQNLNPPLVNAPTVAYFCDTDPPPSMGGSGLPNFLISHDECSGRTLAPFGHTGNSCSLQITFAPQPRTWTGITAGLDDFLQLNTSWCGDSNNPTEPNCEIDSGRFPVEIKTNAPSSLRMLPSAGMDFGTVIKGAASAPLTITLFNDPVDPLADTVTFTSKLIMGADYFEADTCPSSLPTNQSCTITVTFTPKVVGLDPGSIKFTYSTSTQSGLTQTIFLRGTGQ
jgi:hypothetical protein